MDKINYASFFTGIGAGDLAAHWMGWRVLFQCEINPFCRKVLQFYWPEAKLYEDIKKEKYKQWRGTIDVLTGGFPCQGFSLAGQRLGTEDDRYLWPEMYRGIREIHPLAVVAENVTGILSMEDKSGSFVEVFPHMESRKITSYDSVDRYEAVYTRQAHMLIETICEDLEKEGYQVQPFVIPAAGIGAPHKRERVWIVAYSNGARCENRQLDGSTLSRSNRKGRDTAIDYTAAEKHDSYAHIGSRPKHQFSAGRKLHEGNIEKERTDSDSECERLQKSEKSEQSKSLLNVERNSIQGHASDTAGDGLQGGGNGGELRSKGEERIKRFEDMGFFSGAHWQNFPTEPPLCSGNDGLSARLAGITFSKHRNESIKAFGNAQIPQINYQLFKALEILIKEYYNK